MTETAPKGKMETLGHNFFFQKMIREILKL